MALLEEGDPLGAAAREGGVAPGDYGFTRPSLVEGPPGFRRVVDAIITGDQRLYGNASQAHVVQHFLQIRDREHPGAQDVQLLLDDGGLQVDLSIQAQILNLLRGMQRDLGLSFLFISHDLAVVRYMSHRIMVMSNSVIVEAGDAQEVYANPGDPYTQRLLAAASVRSRRPLDMRPDCATVPPQPAHQLR
jgi:hypothetical protein